jgi:hypothetical protein
MPVEQVSKSLLASPDTPRAFLHPENALRTCKRLKHQKYTRFSILSRNYFQLIRVVQLFLTVVFPTVVQFTTYNIWPSYAPGLGPNEPSRYCARYPPYYGTFNRATLCKKLLNCSPTGQIKAVIAELQSHSSSYSGILLKPQPQLTTMTCIFDSADQIKHGDFEALTWKIIEARAVSLS